MFDYLKGELVAVYPQPARIVVEVAGLAYEVFIAPALVREVADIGREVKIYLVESSGLYGGEITLYGFLNPSQREIFLQLRDNIPATGAKKALEYFNKIVGDIEKFQQAVVQRDVEGLIHTFGFTRKTADKIISALKDKLVQVIPEKTPPTRTSPILEDVIAALVAMGYKPSSARQAVEEVQRRNSHNPVEFLDMLRQALSIIR